MSLWPVPFYVAPCPKCGEPKPRIEFAYRCHVPDETRRDHQGEHFHVDCGRCGYRWAKRVGEPDLRTNPNDL